MANQFVMEQVRQERERQTPVKASTGKPAQAQTRTVRPVESTTASAAKSIREELAAARRANPPTRTYLPWEVSSTSAGEDHTEKYTGTLKTLTGRLEAGEQELTALKQRYSAAPSEEVRSAYNARLNSYNRDLDTYRTVQKNYDAYQSPQGIQGRLDQLKSRAGDLERDRRARSIALQSSAAELGTAQGEEAVQRALEKVRASYQAYGETQKSIDALKKRTAELETEGVRRSFEPLRKAADFAEKSAYRSTERGEPKFNALTGIYTDTGFGDITYDYINANERARSRQLVNDMGTQAALLGMDQSFLQELEPDEVALFNYVYAQQGKDSAYQYLKSISGDLTYRQRKKNEAEWAAYAREHPVGTSIFSVLESPMKGLSYLGQAADYLADGQIDQNAAYNKFSHLNSAIRNEVSGIVENRWGKAGSFAYQTGMSMGDFLFNAGITGGNQALSLAIMGSGAAADATVSAKDRGLNDTQSFTLGTVAGLAEIVTEKVSLEALLDKTGMDRNAVGYVLKNILAEGSEEVASDLINLTADVLVSRDQSEWAQAAASYQRQGMSKASAYGRAAADQAAQMGLDFLGGALSGGIMAGGGAALNAGLNAYDRGQQRSISQRTDAASNRAYDTMREHGMFSPQARDTAAASLEEMGRAQGYRTGTGAQLGVQRALNRPQKSFGEAVQEQLMGDRPRSAEEAAQEAAQVQAQRDAQDISQAQKNAATGVEISDRAKKQLSRADRRTLQALSQITGSNIQFVPRAQLEQMARPGAEGMQLGGQIYISEDAQRPYMEIAKHEITHRLQQTAPEQYAAFRDYVADLYRETGDLDAYLRGAVSGYARAGVEISEDGALDELAADYAAKLLVDEKAMRKLAGEDRGLLTRMLDALRDFIAKVKTALGGKGNAETAELEQGAAMLQAALEESAKNSSVEGDGEARYSIAYDRDNRPFVTVEEDILAGVDRKDWVRAVKENLKRKFPNGVTVGNNQIEINAQSQSELTYSKYNKRLMQTDQGRYADKLRATNNADEVLKASGDYVNEAPMHPRRDNIQDFARGTIQLRVGENDYTAQVIVARRSNGKLLLYDIINLEPTSIQEKIQKSDAAIAKDPSPGTDRSTAPGFKDTLPQSPPSVKSPQTLSEEIARQMAGDRMAGETLATDAPQGGTISDEIARQLGGGDQRLATQEGAELLRQVDALRRQNQRLREQMKRTTGSEMDEKSVRQLSRSILKDYNSSYAVDDLSSRVSDLYKKIAEQAISDTDARAEARAIAGDILDGSQTEMNPLYEEYSELRKELRTRGISISPEYRADLDGGYNETRKRMLGTLKLTENGASVDQVYDDLSQRYPELFPEDIYNPADQMNRIIDVAGELQSAMGSAFEGAEADRAADFLAGDIMERFYDTPERAPTFADRQAKKLEAERQRGRYALERQKAMFEGRSEREMEKLRRLREGQIWDQRKRFEKERARDRKAYQEAFERQKELLKKRDEKIAALQERRKAEQAKRQDSVERDKLLKIARKLDQIKTTGANREVINSLIGDLDLVSKSMSGRSVRELMDEAGTIRRLDPDQATQDKITRLDKVHINDMDIQDVRELTNLLLYTEKEMRKRGEILTPKADSEERSKLLRVARRLGALKTADAAREKIDSYISDLDLVSKSITGKTVTKLAELKAWYEDQKANNPDFLSDEAIEKKLARLEKKKIDDMDLADVRDLTDTLLNIENELRTQRKLLNDEDRRDTYRLGQEAAEHIRASKGGARGGTGAALDRYIITETLSPERYVRRLTGYADADPLAARTRDLSKGQRAMLDYKRRAWGLFQTFVDDRGFLSRLTGKKAEAVEITGLDADGPATVQITPDMRVSLYLHSLSDDNLRHIAQGGITVPDMALYRKGDLAEAYARGTTIKLTPSQVRSITSRMTPQELEYANAISRGYFNGMSRQEINQTSEMLKGYSLAKEENYFPIDTDSRFLRQDQPEVKRDGSIEGMGFTKERITNASSPIYLRDASSVLTRAIEQHAMYVGLAIPVRNFHKVYSVTMSGADAKGDHLAYTGSVKQALENKWGSAATGYIDKMLRDLQPGGRGDTGKWGSFFNKIRSNYAGAVLTLNASVAMKQAASYPTAAAVLGWKPLAKAMGDFGKVDLDTINKYTPLLWYRSLGFDGAELGDVSAGNTSMPKALNWIQGIDVMTTRKLWKASEYYVQDHSRSLRKGSGAYYRAVADIYNRVIEETQPNYTAMQRPQLLRSENEFLKTISMFKTQPFQNANILYDAAANYQAKRAQNHRNSTETSRQALRDARRDLGNAVSSQVASVAVFAGMTALWNLFRHREDKYADEDTGEVTAASFFCRFFKDMLSSAAGQVPFGGEVYSAAAGLADKIAGQLEDMEKGQRLANGLRWIGDDYYGMESVTTQALTDAVTAIMKTGDAVGETITAVNNEGPKRNAWLSWTDMAEDVSKLFGIPVENILNVGRASVQWVMQAAYGEALGDYYALAMTTKTSKKALYYDSLWSAYGKDWDAARTIYKDMLELGFDEDGISDAMEDRMAKAFGLGKASSLPVEYSAPGSGGSFDQEVRRQLERGGGWKDDLPKDSGDLAKVLDSLEPEDGEDSVTKRQRIREIGDSPFSDEAKELSVKRLLGEKELERFQAAKKAGISVGAWCRLYEDIARAHEKRTGKSGSATQEDVKNALEKSGLSESKKKAVWDSYGWKSGWDE